MSQHLMNTYARIPVRVARGEGAWLFDEDGTRYLDTLTGIGVCSLGHAHPEIAEVIARQARTLVHAANVGHIPLQEELAGRLAEISGLDQAFFCNSGAEALECCFKLARLHGRQKGIAEPQIVVVSRSFHGRTIACISATDSEKVQGGFGPLVPGFLRVPFDDAGSIARLADDRDDIAAVLCEPILGEGGVVVPHDGYLAELRRICDQHDWLFMADEVQTGMGKTGRWFGYQHEGILPDVIAVAKALGNGVPIGACVARDRAGNLFSPGKHGSTYGGNPLACATALKVIEIMQRDRLVERAAELGQRIMAGLRKRLASDDRVVEIRGRGLMIGIETRAACGPIRDAALEAGMMINVTRDNTIRLLPPLIIDDALADRIVDTVSNLIKAWQT